MAGRVQRPALGQNVPLGTLYNARLDCFLPLTVQRQNTNVPFTTSNGPKTSEPHTRVTHGDSLKDRCSLLGLSSDLAASHFADFLKPLGSGGYLSQPPGDANSPTAALLVAFETFQTHLQLHAQERTIWFDPAAFNSQNATHVVVSIHWGVQSVVTVKSRSSTAKEGPAQCRRDVTLAMEALENACVERIDPASETSKLDNFKSASIVVHAFSDVFDDIGITLQDLGEAWNHLSLLPSHIAHEYEGRGLPVTYTLLQIDILAMMLDVQGPMLSPTASVSSKTMDGFLDLFDQFFAVLYQLLEHRQFARGNRVYFGTRTTKWTKNAINTLEVETERFLFTFAERLNAIRDGKEDPYCLAQLYDTSVAFLQRLPDIAKLQGDAMAKVKLLSSLTAQGVAYYGFNGQVLDAAGFQDGYVLVFNHNTMQGASAWEDNQRVFLDLLQQAQGSNGITFAVVDAEATETVVHTPHILQYKNGKEVSQDVLADTRFAESHALASSFDKSEVKKFEHLPIKRYQVNIPCQTCGTNENCDWLCDTCHAPLQFGVADDHVYCECGKSLYNNFRFKCDGPKHGMKFLRFKPKALLKALRGLSGTDDINILILGETGVGKSTFINAFLNYLTYDTLDDAKSAETLEAIIPCNFSTQIMDRSRPDKPIEQVKISVGERDDEQDGSKGDSATQKTAVYPIIVGTRTIRLIDTPGIGDTRGHSFDKKNMADILQTLKSYDELHGILLLVKSNNARLTVTFNFCVKELLVHLHRSATENMAFAFTNTRISNYTPGDTYGPLSALLAKHADVGLSLTIPTTYCFDSESFRYLAAFKQGHQLANEEDFRRSWQHSRDESHRLVEYFSTRTPHKIKNTVSLHGARQAIADLIKPMAEISSLIRTNIALAEDSKRELDNTQLSGSALRTKLEFMKRCLRSKPLAQPRTVCTAVSCIDVEDDGTGQKRAIYKTHCHAQCYLDNIGTDTVAFPGLIYCAAFGGQDCCSQCSHHWTLHMHVLYELEAYWMKSIDPEIQRQLQKNVDDLTIRQTAVETVERTIEEYRDEHRIVQEAAAQFGVFLRKHAMATHNDATLAYLDMLIRHEEDKISVTVGKCSRQRLKDLEDDKARHIELTQILLSLENGTLVSGVNSTKLDVLDDERDVAELEAKLYGLKHFGDNLRKVKNGITTAHELTNRERPHRVQHKSARPYRFPERFGKQGFGSQQPYTLAFPALQSTQVSMPEAWSINGASSASSDGGQRGRSFRGTISSIVRSIM